MGGWRLTFEREGVGLREWRGGLRGWDMRIFNTEITEDTEEMSFGNRDGAMDATGAG